MGMGMGAAMGELGVPVGVLLMLMLLLLLTPKSDANPDIRPILPVGVTGEPVRAMESAGRGGSAGLVGRGGRGRSECIGRVYVG